LSDVVDAYKVVMKKLKISTLNETYYYTLLIKLSLNLQGKNWKETLKVEKKKNENKK